MKPSGELYDKIRAFLVNEGLRIGPHADDKLVELADTLAEDPAN